MWVHDTSGEAGGVSVRGCPSSPVSGTGCPRTQHHGDSRLARSETARDPAIQSHIVSRAERPELSPRGTLRTALALSKIPLPATPQIGPVRILLVSDLHYSLPQLDWVVGAAPAFDLVVVAGDSLSIRSAVSLDAQSVVCCATCRCSSRRAGWP